MRILRAQKGYNEVLNPRPPSWNRSLTSVCMCVRAGYRLGAATVQRVLIGLVHAWDPLAQLGKLRISVSGVAARSCVRGSRWSVACDLALLAMSASGC